MWILVVTLLSNFITVLVCWYLFKRYTSAMSHSLNTNHEEYHKHYANMWRETYSFTTRALEGIESSFYSLENYLNNEGGSPTCRINIEAYKSDELKDIEDKDKNKNKK